MSGHAIGNIARLPGQRYSWAVPNHHRAAAQAGFSRIAHVREVHHFSPPEFEAPTAKPIRPFGACYDYWQIDCATPRCALKPNQLAVRPSALIASSQPKGNDTYGFIPFGIPFFPLVCANGSLTTPTMLANCHPRRQPNSSYIIHLASYLSRNSPTDSSNESNKNLDFANFNFGLHPPG